MELLASAGDAFNLDMLIGLLTSTPFPIAFAGGLFPALIWLWFFLREDRKNPEPKLLIMLAFIAGMIVVVAALFIEKWLAGVISGGLILIIAWSATEEILKYFAAAGSVLWRPFDDEPIDPMIYMITVALGFAAFETGLFLLKPIDAGNVAGTILTTNLRFMGAALLHVISSAAIGVALGLAFYRSFWVKAAYLCTGIVVATALHTLFNYFIINNKDGTILFVFFFVWLGVIVLFLLFEKVRKITRPLFINPNLKGRTSNKPYVSIANKR